MAFLAPPTQKIERLYFLGIGGIAMGSVAIACNELGYTVSGCDSGVYPPMSQMLERYSILYSPLYSPEHMVAFAPDAIIVGNAISRGNPVLEVALEQNYPLLSMPELLRWSFMTSSHRIVVSGTHGKTTTTNLIAWILDRCGEPLGYLIGGITDQLGNSCRPAPTGGYFVLEGDEYDTAFFDKRSKFLHSMPQLLVITSIEYDHADIFPSYESVLSAFEKLVQLVPRNGLIVACADDAGAMAATNSAPAPVEQYSVGGKAEWEATIRGINAEGTTFRIAHRNAVCGDVFIRMHGVHNIRNATAAIAIAHAIGLDFQQIVDALASFVPPKRRFEVLCEWNGAIVVDDFAHHPTAVRATIAATRLRYPDRRVVVCFEPRSNTSARSIFQEQFADAFSEADRVVLCPLYRDERYPPDQRLDRIRLCDELCHRGVECYVIPSSEQWGSEAFVLLRSLIEKDDVLLLLSNGNIGGLRQAIIADATSGTQTQLL
ncbi:MAG: Mur ligase family protein [Chlorobi bacterium]|nr:Mur ligase family protein [Chlorobiota bacterium]